MLSVLFIALLFSACATPAAMQPPIAVIPEATNTAAPSPTAETLAQVVPGDEATEADVEAPGAARPEALAETLGNLSYAGIFPDHPIQLTDGIAYYSEDGPGKPFVRLIDHLIATGDLEGDELLELCAVCAALPQNRHWPDRAVPGRGSGA